MEVTEMKAAVIYEHGDVDCIKVDNLPEPKINSGEVLVEVRAAALNHLDIWVRRGAKTKDIPKPHILGSDAAGVVFETGPHTHGFQPGDEVILNPGLSCGCCEQCRKGQQSQCLSFGIMGLTRPGTFAERIAVPFQNLWLKPAHLSFEQAAALPLSYVTAWRMLMTRAKLRPGQLVLIHGVGGGAALAALQLALLAGAQTIVTSSSDQKLQEAKNIGADHIINYKTSDVTEIVKQITSDSGVDIIIDTVGAATWTIDFAVVKRGGTIVLCGITTGAIAETNLQALYWNQLNILGSTMGSDHDFRMLLKAVITSELVPVVDSTYPLVEVEKAVEKMEKAGQLGKIVLSIS